MSRSSGGYSGPKLPRSILDQFDDRGTARPNRRPEAKRPTNLASRKDNRKADRERRGVRAYKVPPKYQEADSADDGDGPDATEKAVSRNGHRSHTINPPIKANVVKESKSKRRSDSSSTKNDRRSVQEQDNGSREPVPHVSKHTKERLQADDADIAALEKKLGLKGTKLPKSFHDDGLHDLLEGIEDGTPGAGRKRKKAPDSGDWLSEKRKKQALKLDESDLEESEQSLRLYSDDNIASSEEGIETGKEDDTELQDSQDENEFGGFMVDETVDETPPKAFKQQSSKHIKENPYIAPPTKEFPSQPQKYIPPSRRADKPGEKEEHQRLRRQTQGLLNRLSDSNILSIVSDIDKLFQNNPRQYVSSALVDLLLDLLCDRTALNDTMIILHAGFIAALYRTIGQDVGVQILEAIVQKLDHFYAESSTSSNAEGGIAGKEPVNLISLLGHLFNFQVIGGQIIFDYIRIFLSSLTELHTELILRIVKTSGHQLRQDDPASLKDIVSLLQRTMAANGSGQTSVRTQFMIETINDLKNNRLKAAGSAVAAEHASKMRKTLGSLNSRGTIKASEPLRVSLNDLRNADKKGKWWLVGASWKGSESKSVVPQDGPVEDVVGDGESGDSDAGDPQGFLLQDVSHLAQQHGMHTPLRRSIFAALVTASDYRDACNRLLKLDLSRAQQREISRVLLHCVATERIYNNYYGLVARRLCSGDYKMSIAFQFTLWDFLKRIGADEDDAANERDSLDNQELMGKHKIANHARFFGSLIGTGSLSVTALKVMDPHKLLTRRNHTEQASTSASLFLEILLISVFDSVSLRPKGSGTLLEQSSHLSEDESERKSRKSSNDLTDVFDAALDLPDFASGLGAFIRRVVQKTDFVSITEAKRLRNLRRGCKAACKVLTEKNQNISIDNR